MPEATTQTSFEVIHNDHDKNVKVWWYEFEFDSFPVPVDLIEPPKWKEVKPGFKTDRRLPLNLRHKVCIRYYFERYRQHPDCVAREKFRSYGDSSEQHPIDPNKFFDSLNQKMQCIETTAPDTTGGEMTYLVSDIMNEGKEVKNVYKDDFADRFPGAPRPEKENSLDDMMQEALWKEDDPSQKLEECKLTKEELNEVLNVSRVEERENDRWKNAPPGKTPEGEWIPSNSKVDLLKEELPPIPEIDPYLPTPEPCGSWSEYRVPDHEKDAWSRDMQGGGIEKYFTEKHRKEGPDLSALEPRGNCFEFCIPCVVILSSLLLTFFGLKKFRHFPTSVQRMQKPLTHI